jgi:hypothetical protein
VDESVAIKAATEKLKALVPAGGASGAN